MSVAFLIVLSASQTIVPASPPPIVAQVSPPAIISVSERPRVGELQAQPPVNVHVRVTAGNEVLFDDALRVSRGSGANFQQSRSEAANGVCPPERRYRANRQSLNLSLSMYSSGIQDDRVNVSVNWQRPTDSTDCSSEGTRTAAISQSVTLAQGHSVTLRGDAGLTITLTRR